MLDPRITTLAKNLVNYSVNVQKGEKVLIEAYEIDTPLITELIKAVYEAGGYPYVEIFDTKIQRALLNGTSKEHLANWSKYALARMNDMQCYIGIRGAKNSYEQSDVDSKKIELYASNYSHEVHHNSRVGKTKWVVLRYPNEGMSQLAGMSTEQFENFYFNVCNLDYSKMDRAMDHLKALMERTDKVRITAKNTDISFSIKGIGAKKCSGHMNIPDGEVYSAPVKTSVNGIISYNAPSVHSGTRFENVVLKFKDGKIIESDGNFPEKIKAEFDTDEGARYVGEFAIGVNPYILKPMGDILFDEKITGSIHFTPGSCYKDADNGNVSAIHWDLVLIQTPEYGGGEIYFDNVLIRKDGRFVIKELECLNPENLK